MNKLRDIQVKIRHNFDMAEEMIKTHIELYGEYKRDDDFIENY